MNDIIFSYTREQAIADGVLIDVSKMAAEAGFRYPVALTQAVWGDCVAVSKEDEGQDEQGRLWDILNVLRCSIRSAGGGQLVHFDVLVAKGGKPPQPINLKAHCGPGDELEPVITVMLPHED
ncbi:MAG TPA: DUF6573 family protein [Pirellulales bacterium]|jgi:hypothetical protein